ncbi:MAG: hypothetical protein Q7U14_08240, partial [Lacisediminimonas sp.]|nr:hypothetical protein [Lacisediminimonas sp.]
MLPTAPLPIELLPAAPLLEPAGSEELPVPVVPDAPDDDGGQFTLLLVLPVLLPELPAAPLAP